MFNFMRLPPLRRLMLMKTITGGGSWETVTGAVVNFTTQRAAPLKSLLVSMSPVQDLHGYDAPWPAGGGKNLIDVDESEQGGIDSSGQEVAASDNWRCTNYIPIQGGEAYTLSATITVKRLYFYDGNKNFISPRYESNTNVPVTATAPSNAAYARWTVYRSEGFTKDDILAAQIQLEKGSSATSYAPYSNLCPISGYEGVTAWDDPYYGGLIEWNQLLQNTTADYSNKWGAFAGTLSFDGDIAIVVPNGAQSSTLHYGLGYDGSSTGLVEDHIYFCSGKVKSTQANRYRLRFSNITHYSPSVAAGTWTTAEMIGNATSNLQVLTFYAENDTVYSAEDTISFKDMILCDLTEMFGAGNEPATVEEFRALFPLDYYAYNAGTETTVGAVNGNSGTTVSVTFPDSVYSGTLDVVTGEGEDATNSLILNSSMDMDAYEYNGMHGIAFKEVLPSQLTRATGLCSHSGKVGAYFSPNSIWIGVNSQWLFWIGILDVLGLSTVEGFKDWLDTQTVQIVYERTTASPLSTTPTPINSLVGENNVWSNADTVTVEYRSN